MKRKKKIWFKLNRKVKNSPGYFNNSSQLSADSDNIRMLKMFEIPYSFQSLDSEKPLNQRLQKKDFENRKDLRHLPFVTIDGQTAKDFDDSIYTEKIEKGWKAFISIADVDYYVKENTSLDQEAYQRGNSTYFPDFVAPMLPPYLSQGLCSLNPRVPRLTMTVEIHFDQKGNQKKTFFYESVICSHARLTYEQAQEIIDGNFLKISSAIQESIKSSGQLAQILMNERFKNGSLNLELPETEIFVDSKGILINIVRSQRLFSHKLIEELMLACNKAVAQFLSQKNQALIYRVHETPYKKDLSHLDQFLKSIDSQVDLFEQKPYSFKRKRSLAHQLSQFVQKVKDHPKKLIMHYLILRALAQACYSAYNKGHFGLQFDQYTHFTSPIRRYSDLIVHRILKKTLGIVSGRSLSVKEMEKKAQFLSQCEQRSVKAERQIESIKKARFMQKYLGEEFSGLISSVTKFGFFVTLDSHHVDGLVHLNNLGGQWKFHPSQLFLKAYPSGYLIQQGDEVLVRVCASNVDQGQIDFDLIEHEKKKFHQNQRPSKKHFRKKHHTQKSGRNFRLKRKSDNITRKK